MCKETNKLLINMISKKMYENNFVLSKISLHQLIYIMQEIYSVDTNYHFKLFTYGPYSVDLTTDLDLLTEENIININYCNGPVYFGSKIEPGDCFEELVTNNQNFLIKNSKIVDDVIRFFGKYKTKELELRSAIIYLKSQENISKIEIIERIQIIKPYFTESQINTAVDDVEKFLKTYYKKDC
ncbi:MAG: hypothetical protein ACOCQW_02065 [Halanaerobiaceae bacterium]